MLGAGYSQSPGLASEIWCPTPYTVRIVLALIATTAAGLWAGAILYIGFAEHPSALKVGVEFATEYFRHMSRRTAPAMMVLTATAAVTGAAAWFVHGAIPWLIGAILMAGMFPFTLIMIVPTNRALLKIDAAASPGQAAALHAKWSVMHAWRAILGVPAFPLFLWALARQAG